MDGAGMNQVDLASIESMTEAIARTVDASGLGLKVVADRLGIEVRHFNRILHPHDSRHFPQDKLVDLMRVCKSLLPLEWLAYQMGYALHEQSLRSILEAIRDAMVSDGKAVRFVVHATGRVERVDKE